MNDLEKDIRELFEKTTRTRYQFLLTDLQTCFTGLEMIKFHLSHGNIQVVKKEIASVEKGISAMQRLVPSLGPEQRLTIETKLTDLIDQFERLKAELTSDSGTD
jgi:hypothetical protein